MILAYLIAVLVHVMAIYATDVSSLTSQQGFVTQLTTQRDQPKTPAFASKGTFEYQFLKSKIAALERSMNETIIDSFGATNITNIDLFDNQFLSKIDEVNFDIILSLSLTDQESRALLMECERLSGRLADIWKQTDPQLFASLETPISDFKVVRQELEEEKHLAVKTLFDENRYIGSADGEGKRINRKILEIEKVMSEARNYEDADFRASLTVYKFLKDVARIFLDYNNLFRLPEGVMLSIEEQFKRKLEEVKRVLSDAESDSIDDEEIKNAVSDARLVFKLLPSFRDPVGEASADIDILLADIRKEFLRLGMPADGLELCYIKLMRIRFEKVWYSIDWVLQYVNFIYVQTGRKNQKFRNLDFSAAKYLFQFADWANSVLAWNIDSVEGRLISFTIQSLQNELESADVFKSVKHCTLDPHSI
ncbi:hypothetical protein OXX59_008521 [Metschnikowia pulcherrima]